MKPHPVSLRCDQAMHPVHSWKIFAVDTGIRFETLVKIIKSGKHPGNIAKLVARRLGISERWLETGEGERWRAATEPEESAFSMARDYCGIDLIGRELTAEQAEVSRDIKRLLMGLQSFPVTLRINAYRGLGCQFTGYGRAHYFDPAFQLERMLQDEECWLTNWILDCEKNLKGKA